MLSKLIPMFLSRLRFPQLFALVAGLFVVDLIFPDFIAFVDEAMLGLLTLLLGSWKRDRQESSATEPQPEMKDVTPPAEGD